MNIEKAPQDTPRPLARLDYVGLASSYNELKVGEALKLEGLTNITNFKRAVDRRGIKEGEDYRAWQRKGVAFMQRLSPKPMTN